MTSLPVRLDNTWCHNSHKFMRRSLGRRQIPQSLNCLSRIWKSGAAKWHRNRHYVAEDADFKFHRRLRVTSQVTTMREPLFWKLKLVSPTGESKKLWALFTVWNVLNGGTYHKEHKCESCDVLLRRSELLYRQIANVSKTSRTNDAHIYYFNTILPIKTAWLGSGIRLSFRGLR